MSIELAKTPFGCTGSCKMGYLHEVYVPGDLTKQICLWSRCNPGTLFNSRHNPLTALRHAAIDKLEGIAEMDKTYLLFAEEGKKNITVYKPSKQVFVLVAWDPNKNSIAKAVCLGRIFPKKMIETIGSYLIGENIICADGWHAFFYIRQG